MSADAPGTRPPLGDLRRSPWFAVRAGQGDGGADAPATQPPSGDLRRSPWFLLLDLPFVAAGPVMVIPRHHPTVSATVVLVLAALGIAGLQARHSLHFVRGERPAVAVGTFLALAALVYVPMWWYTWDWAVTQWFVVASALMVLPGRVLRIAAAAAPVVGQTAVAAWFSVTEPGVGPGLEVVVTLYHFTFLAMGGAVIYGSVWLGRVLRDLEVARTEMAELAVERERLRMSRDVHDLLGQSLSAVSLKGDLALRLLPTDAAAARAEIESLTDVARGALRDVRAVVQDRHVVSLPAEVEAATVVLRAAGVAAHIDVDLPDLAWPVEEVLAWAVREGTTNMLRHSDATTCSIATTRQGGTVRLEVVNDGVRAADSDGDGGDGRSGDRGGGGRSPLTGDGTGGGTGIAGLSGRARAVSGSASAGRTPDGRFRLVVEVPDVHDVPDAPDVASVGSTADGAEGPDEPGSGR